MAPSNITSGQGYHDLNTDPPPPGFLILHKCKFHRGGLKFSSQYKCRGFQGKAPVFVPWEPLPEISCLRLDTKCNISIPPAIIGFRGNKPRNGRPASTATSRSIHTIMFQALTCAYLSWRGSYVQRNNSNVYVWGQQSRRIL